jgi:glycosyltransferase involved in cell wall biosynthesis
MADQNNLKNRGLSVVLGTYNRKTFLKQTIESVRQELSNATFPYEIIVIDGGSTDGTLHWLTQQKDIILIIQHNRGKWQGKKIKRKSWGYFMNLGFKCAQGKYICMLSDDCLVIPGAIIDGYNLFELKLLTHEKVGAVAFFYRDWPDQIKYHVHTYWGVVNVNHGLYLNEALKKVDYIDEDTYQFYSGDIDLVYKLLNDSYTSIFSENSFIEHFVHANIQNRLDNYQIGNDDSNKFYKKWSPIFKNIDLSASDKRNQIEINFTDKYDTIQFWQKLIVIKFFLVRRYFVQNLIKLAHKYLPPQIKKG